MSRAENSSGLEGNREQGIRVSFDLATPEDDLALRQLLQSIRMDGVICVSFRREPNYFAAHHCEGDFVQVITARDRTSGQIVGMGSRSVRDRYVAGVPRSVGYLSGLRIHPRYRGGTMLARGYQYLKQLDQDQRAEFYVTTIAIENKPATVALLGGRAGLPFYIQIGRLNTWIIPKRKIPPRKTARCSVRPVTENDLDSLMSFLEQFSMTRALFPCYQKGDFAFPSRTFEGMRRNDLKGLWMDDQLVGTLGMWDQRGVKQYVVEKYEWWLGWTRPLYNVGAALTGRVRIPPPGASLPLVTGALPLATERGVEAFGDLVDSVAFGLPNDADAIMIGLCEEDPLTEVLRSRTIQKYQTGIYVVSWDGDKLPAIVRSMNLPYLELGTL